MKKTIYHKHSFHTNQTIRRLVCSLMVFFLMLPVVSLADIGIVSTNGGTLNVRKVPVEGSKLVTRLKNGTTIDILDQADGWYHISFKGKEGYVKTEYVKLLSDAVGKEIYSNGVTIYLHESMSKDSMIVGMLNSQQPMKVEQITAEWALVSNEEVKGYVQTDDIDQLNGKPIAAATHTWEKGILQSKTVLYKEANKKSGKLGTYKRGQPVYISTYNGSWSLIWIVDEGVYGFAQNVSVKLSEVADGTEVIPGETKVVDESQMISSSSARTIAEKALKKYSGFSSTALTCTSDAVMFSNGISGPMYRYYYSNKKGEHVYTAFIQSYTGDVLFTADYSQFAYGKGASDLKTAAPTKEPVYEYDSEGNIINIPEPLTGTDIGQSAARSIADRYLNSRYPHFSQTSFSRVSCQHFTDPINSGGFQTPYYQFDYFVEDDNGHSQLAFEIMIHAYTKEILYCIGGDPGEGNG